MDTTVSLVMGVRAAAFDRPEAAEFSAKLAAGLTDAITAVLGEELRPGTTVELVASPQERTFVAASPRPDRRWPRALPPIGRAGPGGSAILGGWSTTSAGRRVSGPRG
ncbi:hypothetical protein [Actinomadura madurae]|uniref:hypothetical protein n=1 Tax=Actinomadura madurae TaxID=1993 RepID=UPI0020D25860|nr:hypothetical protein [Actinomadura madurae]MCP9981531.1 hypothetical protein [Actinomadura madurae]